MTGKKVTPLRVGLPQAELNEDELKRTRHFFGKPYHWELNEAGHLTLKAGWTEHEKVRMQVVEVLVNKGVPPEEITPEMVEQVVSKAESAAIMEAVTGVNEE